MDPINKLIIAWHVGGGGSKDARSFLTQLKGRLPGKFQLTTDSLKHYIKLVPEVFEDIDFATVKKRDPNEERARLAAERKGLPYHPPRRPKDAPPPEKQPPAVHLGSPEPSLITTNHIEAFFTKFRTDMGRMTRRGTTMSKKIENLRRSIALYVFHHNFVKRHHSLRNKTPAEFSGIDDSAWTWGDFIEILDDFRAAKKAMLPKEIKCKPNTSKNIPETSTKFAGGITVFHNIKQDTSKLHRPTCKHLRNDPAREGKLGGGVKHFCEDINSAMALAERLTPGFVTECKVCLGSYSTLGYQRPERRAQGSSSGRQITDNR
jgi:hypothetical protein